MLLCFWSPKGGSGTSVFAAACALVLARDGGARLADLRGDQPAVLALGVDPETGLRDWLGAGPGAPADALDRLAVDTGRGVELLPAGRADVNAASPEAGAALAVVLRDDVRTTIADVGTLVPGEAPALHALVEVADASVLVVRGCYLALRRAVRIEATARADGAVLLEESGRSLGAHEVADVLGMPVLATVPVRSTTARAVDAGVVASRVPESSARAAREVLARLGCTGRERAA